jgi:hypothetical protein
MQQSPRTCSGRSVLTGHQKCNHHVRNVPIRQGCSILVRRTLKSRDHIVFMLSELSVRAGETADSRHGTHVMCSFPSLPNDALIEFAHRLLGLVSAPITRQRQLGKHEIDRCKSAIEVFISLRKCLVQTGSNLFALQRSRSSQDGEFRHGVQSIETLPLVVDSELFGHEAEGFVRDHANVGSQVFGRETEFYLNRQNKVRLQPNLRPTSSDLPFAFAASTCR